MPLFVSNALTERAVNGLRHSDRRHGGRSFRDRTDQLRPAEWSATPGGDTGRRLLDSASGG